MLLENAAHPDAGGRLEIGAADYFAVEVLWRLDAGGGVDEDEAVAEAAMQEHRNGGQRLALVADHEIGADIFLADVEFVLAAHAPVALARPHVGQEDEFEPIRLDRTLLERADDVVVAAGDCQSQFAHCALLLTLRIRRAIARNVIRRGERFR